MNEGENNNEMEQNEEVGVEDSENDVDTSSNTSATVVITSADIESIVYANTFQAFGVAVIVGLLVFLAFIKGINH